ncbi:hypothetical protein OK016_24400 [Vibrio chagasii]|nr:hypothetical protein [Vibrio chagasii]
MKEVDINIDMGNIKEKYNEDNEKDVAGFGNDLHSVSVNSYAKTPIDLGVVNEDKLIEMLVRQGLVDEN